MVDWRVKRAVMIHQPNFLPWPPYLARVVLCEKFVVLDDLPYKKNYYQNRTKVMSPSGHAEWFSLPVAKRKKLNQSFVVGDRGHVIRKRRTTLRQYYSSSEFFDFVWPAVDDFLGHVEHNNWSLSKISTESIMLMLRLCGMSIPQIVFQSELEVFERDRTLRLVRICSQTNSIVLLNGWGGSGDVEVHDHGVLSDHGISMRYIDPTAKGSDQAFVRNEGLSSLHWLFVLGPDKLRSRLEAYRRCIVDSKERS